jgi:pantetheine-phosphate adenylyltransferase
LFSVEERLRMINEVLPTRGRMSRFFQGLLVDYAEKKHSKVIIRGLRAISDFEYEFQMAMNHRPTTRTFFPMTGESEFYTSSRLVKEVVSLGGDVSGLVPDNVLQKLKQKFKR